MAFEEATSTTVLTGRKRTGMLSGNRKWVVLILSVAVLAVVIGVAVGVPLSKRAGSDAKPTASFLERAKEILKRYPLVDG